MIRALIVAALLFCAPAQAQLLTTGVGPGGQSSGPPPVSYTGPGDIVSGADGYWGLRGYNGAFSGAVANICDSATGLVCADVTWAAGALTFPLIGGIACNNVTNLCQVKILYDQSGKNACGGPCDITIATAGRRPSLIVAGASNGCPSDAVPCMAFVRAQQQCLAKAGAYTQVQPIGVMFTANRTGNTTLAQPAISIGGLSLGWSNAANTARIAAGTTQNVGSVNDATWHAIQGVWSDLVGVFSADGATTSAANGANEPLSSNIILGAGSTTCASNAFDGKATEFGIWPSDITASIAALNTNQHSYWGF